MLISFVGRPRLCGGRPWLSSAWSRGSVARYEVRQVPAREPARREVLRRVCGAAGGGGHLCTLRDAPADRGAEDARRLLDAVLGRMIEAVHHYEGTVNQVMGDGIMALFGAPIAHEDHAVRACYAALRMQQRVKEYAEELHRSLGLPVHIR